jgi:hypothetical protein
MFNIAVFIALLATAAAFSPVGRITGRSTAMKMAFEDELGVLPPVGFWDPLGLAADGDEETFRRRRATELKHGRVAMLAVTGYLVQEVCRFPGTIDLNGLEFSAIPNGVDAIAAIPAFGWFQIAASIGYWEIFGWQQEEGAEPGTFGTGYFGRSLEGEELAEKLTKEIQNGRLAMLGIMELLTHDVATNGESLFAWHGFQ